jgi:acyl-CoA thioesterase-1
MALLLAPSLWARAAEPARAGVLVVGDSLSAEYGLRRGSGWVNGATPYSGLRGVPVGIDGST